MFHDVAAQTPHFLRRFVFAGVRGVKLPESVVRPSRSRVRIVHEGVVATFHCPEGDPVWRTTVDVRHRSDVSSIFGFLRER